MHEKHVFIFNLHCMFALSVLFRYARDIAFDEYRRQKDNIYPPQYAGRANDGNIQTCSRTSNNSNAPWWRLWLPRKELITGLVLITETDKLSNFKRFKVTVEEVAIASTQESNTNNQMCYTYPDTSPPNNTIEVTCNQPLLNNQIRITLDGASTQLVICDIRVYGGKNLAFGKAVDQRSSAGSEYNAALAVDGVLTSNICSKTLEEVQPWWSVDLNYIMHIQAVRIWTSSDSGLRYFRLQGKNVSSDNWLTLYDDAGNYNPTKSISLVTKARYLRVLIYNRTSTLVICEVEVFGECPVGRWGPGCGFLCGNCLGPCSGQTGHCPQGCNDGYKNTTTCKTACNNGRYGSNCLGTCGHCRNGAACQKGNGSCSDRCAPGWQGDLCKEACADGKYGSNCVETCGHCRDGASCQKDNGLCSNSCTAGWHGGLCQERCTSGWYGDNCSQECSDHCKGGYTNCNNVDGNCDLMCAAGWMGQKCDAACRDGKYGSNCVETCGHCRDGAACQKDNGLCSNICAAGWHGGLCQERCTSGRYGDNCSQKCSDNCNGGFTNCNNVNGNCDLMCAAGWMGQKCDAACQDGTWVDNCSNKCGHCLTGSCDRFSGVCYGGCQPGYKHTSLCTEECISGRWGGNCSRECGHCLTGSCNGFSGICDGGCQPGYQYASHCIDECPQGTYGISCLGTCGNCTGGIVNCEKVTGTCVLGCAEGFVGYGCIKALIEPSSQQADISVGVSAAVVGVVVGVVVAVVAVVIVIVVVFVFKRKRQSMSNTHGNEHQIDTLPSVSYNADNPSNKYDALQVTHGEVNPYDKLDTTEEEDNGVYEVMEP